MAKAPLNLNRLVRRLRVARYGGPTRDQIRRMIQIYIYIYIYTREMRQPTRVTGSLCSQLRITRKRYTLGSLIRPRAVTRCNLAVSGMYMRDFGKMHQIAYTYCSVGITDLKPLTGTSADQLPHRKSRSLATA